MPVCRCACALGRGVAGGEAAARAEYIWCTCSVHSSPDSWSLDRIPSCVTVWVDAANVRSCLAASAATQRQLMRLPGRELAAAALAVLPRLPPWRVAALAVALARMQLLGAEGFKSGLVEHVVGRLYQVRACGWVGGWVFHVYSTACGKAPVIPEVSLSLILAPRDAPACLHVCLLGPLASSHPPHTHTQFSPQQLADVAWALATARQYDVSFLEALAGG